MAEEIKDVTTPSEEPERTFTQSELNAILGDRLAQERKLKEKVSQETGGPVSLLRRDSEETDGKEDGSYFLLLLSWYESAQLNIFPETV